MPDERTAAVKELARAVSEQSQVANRYWLALITVAIASTLGRVDGSNLSLPFGLGELDSPWLYAAMLALLVVLVIAFASAYAQQVRAQRMAYRGLDALGEEMLAGMGIHPRDLFDALRSPSVMRIAPLAQLLRGLDTSFALPGDIPRWRRSACICYYLVLKTVAWLVYFGYPALALFLTVAKLQQAGWVGRIMLVPTAVGTLALLHVFLVDVRYVGQVKSIIGSSKPPSLIEARREPNLV